MNSSATFSMLRAIWPKSPASQVAFCFALIASRFGICESLVVTRGGRFKGMILRALVDLLLETAGRASRLVFVNVVCFIICCFVRMCFIRGLRYETGRGRALLRGSMI